MAKEMWLPSRYWSCLNFSSEQGCADQWGADSEHRNEYFADFSIIYL